MRKTYAVTDKNGKQWLVDTRGYPERGEGIEEWVEDDDIISFDLVSDLMPIYKEMVYFYAGNQTWEDEPVEIPPMSTFIKDLYSRKDENGNQFKYFIFKIEDLADAMGENIEVFFEIADMYNQYRANHKGKAPSKYWIINRDEVPEIKSFEEFKKKVTE